MGAFGLEKGVFGLETGVLVDKEAVCVSRLNLNGVC